VERQRVRAAKSGIYHRLSQFYPCGAGLMPMPGQALRLRTFQRRTTLDKDSCSALLAGMSVKPSRITLFDRV